MPFQFVEHWRGESLRVIIFATIAVAAIMFGAFLSGPQALTAGQHSGLQFEVLEHHPLLTNPEQHPARSYVEMLWEFFKDHPKELAGHDFKVTIKCRDADDNEVVGTMNLRCQYNPTRLKALPCQI